AAAVRGATVLPHQGAVKQRPALPVPDHDGFTLIGDPKSGGSGSRLLQRFPGRFQRDPPDLVRVVLHPAGLRKMLPELAVPATQKATVAADHERRGARGSLVEGEDRTHGTNLRLDARGGGAGPTEQVDDLLVGGLLKVLVPFADR